MKAFSIVSLLALGIAGTACSQTVEAAEEDTETKTEVAETSTEVSGSFNLGLPSEPAIFDGTSTDGFNLGLGSTDVASTDGFNLGTDVSASNGLAALPELETEIGEDVDPLDELAIETPDLEEIDDEEPVIRLE
mgnify:CR=1 FL=1